MKHRIYQAKQKYISVPLPQYQYTGTQHLLHPVCHKQLIFFYSPKDLNVQGPLLPSQTPFFLEGTVS